jgi:hypothetical protein
MCLGQLLDDSLPATKLAINALLIYTLGGEFI